MYLVPFVRYSASNGVTLKSGLEVIENSTIRKLGYGFLFAFYSNYGHILYHFRDKARDWSKIASFSHALQGVTRWNIAIKLSTVNLVWCGYQMVKKV